MSNILDQIPESYFASMMGKTLEVGNKPLINLAVGIPDTPTPDAIISALQQAVTINDNNKYGAFRGKEALKIAIQKFYKDVYDVDLDKDEEIVLFYGTKNGLVHLPLCVIEPGDGVMLPDPGFSDYAPGVALARGKHIPLLLDEANGYLPDFDAIPEETLDETKLIYLNYPSNPTGAVATKAFFDETIERFKGTGKVIVHDFAYAPYGFDEDHPSILMSEGAKEVAVEVYSMSKGFSMSGMRLGFAVGNKEVIRQLHKFHDLTQAGIWGTLQEGAIAAFELGKPYLDGQREIFKRRRDLVEDVLSQHHIPHSTIGGGIFLWLKVPAGFNGETFTQYLLEHQSILVTPGIAFGQNGDQYVRVSLAIDDAVIEEFLERLVEEKDLYEE